MSRMYIASPFFDDFDKRVRDLMQESVHTLGPNWSCFRPDMTESSIKYSTAEGNSRFTLARAIYQDNIREITASDALVFPKGTTDLGTLFEVGYAIAIGRDIYRFDYLTMTLKLVNEKEVRVDSEDQCPEVVHLKKASSAVLFGYLAGKGFTPAYELSPRLHDNIMFAANFDRAIYTRIKPELRNWEETID